MPAQTRGEEQILEDGASRELVRRELDVCMLVEAAAGTGKTRSMVERMVRLLEEGKCKSAEIAAMTFTRKAAAELSDRFEEALSEAVLKSSGARRKRLEQALEERHKAFVGTIHSFCAMLIRERPVEAGVGLDFKELDEAEDADIREDAWLEYVTRARASDDKLVRELDELGVDLGALQSAFERFCEYPDVEEWPAASPELPDPSSAAEKLCAYVRELEEIIPTLPEKTGNDALIPTMRRVSRMLRQADLRDLSALVEIMEVFLSKPRQVLKHWPDNKRARLELERWERFGAAVAKPFVDGIRQRRYALIMKAFSEAREVYDRIRRERSVLNYQDLLMKAAKLLREHPHVRRRFAERFKRILVDEFQDTDPIQAEVLLLLASQDPEERDWRRVKPRPGSLFLVGDPKQSIYRFRRADIATYMYVAQLLRETGGLVVTFSRNFRSSPDIIDWVNGVFQNRFPKTPTDIAPAYVKLAPADPRRTKAPYDDAVCVLRIPEDCPDKASAIEYESQMIAEAIRLEIRSGRSPGDFMIITFTSKNLDLYARALENAGIPYKLSGGGALNSLEELRLLKVCLKAAGMPEDELALVAALRSAVFGISDAQLFELSNAGGAFSYLAPLPQGLRPETAAAFERAFSILRRCADFLLNLPPAAALRAAAHELGLVAKAASGPGGDFRAGSLLKAIELAREHQVSGPSEAIECLERLVEASRRSDRHEGCSALPERSDAVRIMNLHKAKGLEAKVVFLADPSGASAHQVEFHVDRSGPRVRGYLAIWGGSRATSQGRLIACPPNWEIIQAQEQEFLKAEQTRLFYVAATRAGQRLVISQRASGNHKNPWKFFEECLVDRPELAVSPGTHREAAPEEVQPPEVVLAEARAASEALRRKRSDAARAGYELAAVREEVLGRPTREPDEYASRRGDAIHMLLRLAATDPECDIHTVANSMGLNAFEKQEVTSCVEAVTNSELWRRMRCAKKALVETPFAAEIDGKTVRGVMDLAFLEEDGWVVVDYKTDRVDERLALAKAEDYMPQVRLYARVLKGLVAEAVKEWGIYLTHVGRFVAERP